MGLIAPTIFFSVAAFLLNVVLTRLISVQREQIAALKAFGYTRLQIGLHYLKLVLLIALVGNRCWGLWSGSLLGRSLTELYTRFYRFPVFGFEWNAGVVLGALAIGSAAAVAGTLAAVRRACGCRPPKRCGPNRPAVYRPTLLDRTGLGDRPAAGRPHDLPRTGTQAGQVGHVLRRHLDGGRDPGPGVSFTLDSINYIIDFQFGLSQRQDLIVCFVEPGDAPGRCTNWPNFPGVVHCEPIRTVATRFRFGHRSRRVGIIGLSPRSRLYRLLDDRRTGVPVPRDGLLLSTKLAELLDVRLGDRIRVEVLEGEQPMREVPVAAMVTEYGGTNAYMDMLRCIGCCGRAIHLTGAFLAGPTGPDGRAVPDAEGTRPAFRA